MQQNPYDEIISLEEKAAQEKRQTLLGMLAITLPDKKVFAFKKDILFCLQPYQTQNEDVSSLLIMKGVGLDQYHRAQFCQETVEELQAAYAGVPFATLREWWKQQLISLRNESYLKLKARLEVKFNAVKAETAMSYEREFRAIRLTIRNLQYDNDKINGSRNTRTLSEKFLAGVSGKSKTELEAIKDNLKSIYSEETSKENLLKAKLYTEAQEKTLYKKICQMLADEYLNVQKPEQVEHDVILFEQDYLNHCQQQSACDFTSTPEPIMTPIVAKPEDADRMSFERELARSYGDDLDFRKSRSRNRGFGLER